MAGQLGLNPSTMTLCSGGATNELEQALKNCEAVSECFRSSVSTSSVIFVMYCSSRIQPEERKRIEDKLHGVLEEMRIPIKIVCQNCLIPFFCLFMYPIFLKGKLLYGYPCNEVFFFIIPVLISDYLFILILNAHFKITN